MSQLNRFFMAAVLIAAGLRAEIKVGDAFPDLAGAGVVPLAGGALPKTAGKVTLVDFWASWCAPCKASFPAMAKLHTDFAARGLVVAAVSVDEKAAPAEAFARKLAPPFATLLDRDKKLVSAVAVPAMPTSYLVGTDGRVKAIYQGFHGDDTDRVVRRDIETALAQR
jgi:thiol-disulfide isomerase/thioredoxin